MSIILNSALSSAVNSAIRASDLQISVLSGTWPVGSQFAIQIDSEQLLVTAVSSGVNGVGPFTFTVLRGQNSTTAAAHNVSALVSLILTSTGTVGGGGTGADGATGPAGPPGADASKLIPTLTIVPPVLADFTGVGYASALATTNYHYRLVTKAPNLYFYYNSTNFGSQEGGAFVRPVNASNGVAWTATLGFVANISCRANCYGGICVYEQSTDKVTMFGYRANYGVNNAQAINYTMSRSGTSASTSYTGTVFDGVQADANDYVFIQLRYVPSESTTQFKVYQSKDGIDWAYVATAAFNDCNNIAQISHVGVACNYYQGVSNDPTARSGYTIFHWTYVEG